MNGLVLAVKSLSSDKACGLEEVVTQILKLDEMRSHSLDMLNNI
jgi:hypothetical protein